MATTSTPFIDFNAINADLLKFTTGVTGILDKLQKGEEVSALDWGKLVNDGAQRLNVVPQSTAPVGGAAQGSQESQA
jgi:hypothetical protein